ncbi:tetratricopeptide repeat protein [Flexithrix dorotheae]|uniref:tetratricopeptide repeat protein n=1 Tax=Flexithrix dorotheae TaxID=70993 RepID=UPI00037F7DB3|nr:tetratricopeptide repeat protein [Flexithrix dorotheae]
MAEFKYDIDQIDAFLKGKMQGEELNAFKAYMQIEEAFSKEVELQKDLLISLNAHFNKELKQKLIQSDKSGAKAINKKLIPNYIKFGFAASVILFLFFGYFFLFQSIDNTAIYTEFYKPYPNIVSPQVRGVENIQTDILQYYEIADYNTAIILLEKELEKNDAPLAYRFYYGLSLMEIGKTDQAIVVLNQVAESGDAKFKDPAQWYLGLIYLKQNDLKKAENIFESIAKSDNSYKKRAGELLEQLN